MDRFAKWNSRYALDEDTSNRSMTLSPIALASGGVAITNLKTKIMELRIGITITNHVTLIAGGSYRIIGKWHREDGMYVAKINDGFLGVFCSVKGKTVQTLKDEVKRTLEKHAEAP